MADFLVEALLLVGVVGEVVEEEGGGGGGSVDADLQSIDAHDEGDGGGGPSSVTLLMAASTCFLHRSKISGTYGTSAST